MKYSQLFYHLSSILLISSSVVYAQDIEEKQPAEESEARPAPSVTFVEVSPQDLPYQLDRLGVVEASRKADVRARVEGYLSERLFTEGETVKKDQLLYRIEPETYEADVNTMKADLEDAKARLDLATRDLNRTSKLISSQAISQDTLDKTEIERDRAQAAVSRAEAKLNEANLELSYTKIYSPVSGIIEKALLDEGDYVSSDSGSILTTVTTISPIYVTYGISERSYLKISQNSNEGLSKETKFYIMLQDGQKYEEVGKLNYVSPDFDASTGMLRVRVEFSNKNGVLKPNQFVKVIEDHGVEKDVLTVPKQSVFQTPHGAAVMVIDEADILQFRPVTVGSWVEEDWVIKTGLQDGERVMVEGLMKSQPGGPVSPIPFQPKTTN